MYLQLNANFAQKDTHKSGAWQLFCPVEPAIVLLLESHAIQIPSAMSCIEGRWEQGSAEAASFQEDKQFQSISIAQKRQGQMPHEKAGHKEDKGVEKRVVCPGQGGCTVARSSYGASRVEEISERTPLCWQCYNCQNSSGRWLTTRMGWPRLPSMWKRSPQWLLLEAWWLIPQIPLQGQGLQCLHQSTSLAPIVHRWVRCSSYSFANAGSHASAEA